MSLECDRRNERLRKLLTCGQSFGEIIAGEFEEGLTGGEEKGIPAIEDEKCLIVNFSACAKDDSIDTRDWMVVICQKR